jgi:hypothetical protein
VTTDDGDDHGAGIGWDLGRVFADCHAEYDAR